MNDCWSLLAAPSGEGWVGEDGRAEAVGAEEAGGSSTTVTLPKSSTDICITGHMYHCILYNYIRETH
jgi:hypothetical protein